jgi:SAM-dependent methyltransferase
MRPVPFDARVPEYDRVYDADDLDGDAARSRLAAAVDLIGSGTGRVLDAGAGTGRLLEQLEQRGWTGWGIDASINMTARARQRVPAAAARIVQGRVESLPFADRSFDVVACLGVLSYVTAPRQAIGELARVLKPGGVAVMSFGNAGSPNRLWRDAVIYPVARFVKRGVTTSRPPPLRRHQALGRRRIAALLRDAGLEPFRTSPAVFAPLPDPLAWLLPGPAHACSRFVARRGLWLRSLAALHLVVAARK